MARREQSTLSNTQVKVLKRFEKEAMELPPFPEEWLSQDVDISLAVMGELHRTGIVESVGRDRGGNGGLMNRHIWQTADGVDEWVERHIECKTWTPCGCSTGIRTVEAGETYSCRNDECDCQFDRETALEVVG